ncbi:autotransporter domain-containing protein [Phenylobacterium deserti]|uniref:Autotransporter outer membrane beta-barrel domain-containing protein n=1 Tax=Phenylobacterium deserti TaxID=1914756 RepID=A0A328ANE7_9CAUL|nr:autotransporter domain-containing protein [Phenylobacterium deserti]RAK56450.1 autotransporter outer membrane beta-barrel domain-containing protein [Phenylobacterium deserti]
MKRALILATTMLAGLGAASLAHAQEAPFNGVVVFGDSLSDAGNISIASGSPVRTRFTTNPGLVTFEGVAQYYGLPLAPSLAGGTDFAFGGAGFTVNAPGTPAGVPTITTQVNSYLAARPTLDPQTLYGLWGGANDIFYHATAAGAGTTADALIAQRTVGLPPAAAAQVAAQIRTQVAAAAGVAAVETSEQAARAVGAAADQQVALINRLQDAGARYLVVMNLPDVGLTPSARAQGPAGQASLTTLATSYNAILGNGLANADEGIVPVNTFGLIREIIANPSVYGFTNVTQPACTTSSSVTCTPATLVAPNAGSTYLYADGVHPTAAAHAALTQVVISELVAPQQMSLLAETPLAVLESNRMAIGAEMGQDLPEGTRAFAVGRFGSRSLKGGLGVPESDSDDRLLTVGLTMSLGSSGLVGGALTLADSETELAGQAGGFDTRGVIGTIFGQYRFGAGYVGGLLGFGKSDFQDIQRAFQIGAARRVETSETEGASLSADIIGGWWFDAGALRTGPFAALSYDRVRVEGFAEDSGDSTAMRFGDQRREALVGRIGWKVQGEWAMGETRLFPTASLAYAHDTRADQRSVTAGLTTMPGMFSMPGYMPEESWGEAQVGLGVAFGANLRGHVAYQGRISGDTDLNVASVGLSYSF